MPKVDGEEQQENPSDECDDFLNDTMVEAAALMEAADVHVEGLVVATVEVDAARARHHEAEEEQVDLAGVGAAVGHVAVEEVPVGGRGQPVREEDVQHVLLLVTCSFVT